MMTETCKKLIKKCAFFNFGIPTAIIGVIIYYFMSKGVEQYTLSQITSECLFSALFTALIIPFFGPLVASIELKSTEQFIIGIAKEQHPLLRFIPQNKILAAMVICFMVTVVLGLLPFGILQISPIDFSLSRFSYGIFKLIYGLIIAFAAGWLGLSNTLYSMAGKGKVIIEHENGVQS